MNEKYSMYLEGVNRFAERQKKRTDCGVKRKIANLFGIDLRISKMWRIADLLRIWPRIADSACEEVEIVDPKRTFGCGS